MSKTREDSINLIAHARAFRGLTISQAQQKKPAAFLGLHTADLQWIKRHPDEDAFIAAQRLQMRNGGNPEGAGPCKDRNGAWLPNVRQSRAIPGVGLVEV